MGRKVRRRRPMSARSRNLIIVITTQPCVGIVQLHLSLLAHDLPFHTVVIDEDSNVVLASFATREDSSGRFQVSGDKKFAWFGRRLQRGLNDLGGDGAEA